MKDYRQIVNQALGMIISVGTYANVSVCVLLLHARGLYIQG